MSLIRSGQKNLDEIQRIRVALEDSGPVITGTQRELIDKYAAILGEDGKAMIEAIEEEARMPGKLPADVFRIIESCLHSLGQRAKRQDLSNEVIKQREPERLMQVEAIREHTTKLAGARLNGDNATVESIRQATLKVVGKFMETVDKDRDDGLDLDTARMEGSGARDCSPGKARPASRKQWRGQREYIRTHGGSGPPSPSQVSH
jgi:hypothetical protein